MFLLHSIINSLFPDRDRVGRNVILMTCAPLWNRGYFPVYCQSSNQINIFILFCRKVKLFKLTISIKLLTVPIHKKNYQAGGTGTDTEVMHSGCSRSRHRHCPDLCGTQTWRSTSLLYVIETSTPYVCFRFSSVTTSSAGP